MKIFAKDISEKNEFKYDWHSFKMVEDYGNHIYLFHRTGEAPYTGEPLDLGYELVVGVPHKNPDGNTIHRYPKSSEWGMYGWTFKNIHGEPFKRKLEELKRRRT